MHIPGFAYFLILLIYYVIVGSVLRLIFRNAKPYPYDYEDWPGTQDGYDLAA